MNLTEKDIQEFLESGLLEQYLLGATSDSETRHVEQLIAENDSIKEKFQELEDDLESFALLNAVVPTSDIKTKVLEEIDSEATASYKPSNWMNVAAMIVTLIALAGFVYLYQINNNLKDDVVETQTNLENLERSFEFSNEQRKVLEERLAFIESADTDKYLLRGYIEDKPLRVIAYHNAPQGKAQIEIASLPELDEDHDFQLWADVDGEMISLAVIDDVLPKTISEETLKSATDLNITIEKAGGSKHATVENLVATIPLRAEP